MINLSENNILETFIFHFLFNVLIVKIENKY